MMYLEVEKQEAVQEEILKGLENKQPKIVAGSVNFFRMAIRYGKCYRHPMYKPLAR